MIITLFWKGGSSFHLSNIYNKPYIEFTLFYISKMIITLYMDDLNYRYIDFLESKENKITNGLFTKIIYSNSIFTMSGLFFYFPINVTNINNNYNRTFINFDINDELNSKIINYLSVIENNVLSMYNFSKNKELKFLLKEQLLSGYIKIHSVNNNNDLNSKYIVKISGIWENEKNIGITYKIITIKDTIIY